MMTGIGSRMLSFAHRTAGNVRTGSARFGTASVAIALFAIVANIDASDASLLDSLDTPRLLSTLYVAGLASVAVQLFAETRSQRVGVFRFLGAPLAAIVLAALVWFSSPFHLFTGAVTAALLFLIPLSPFIGRGTPRQFWNFTLWTVLGSALALAGVVLFLIGLLALISLVGLLFGRDVGEQVYIHLSVTALTLVGPLVALGRIPRPEEDAALPDDRLSAFVRPIFEWIAVPFTIVMAAILHLYAVRSLLAGEVPHDEIGWIAAFFLLMSFALRLGIEPYRSARSTIVDFVVRWWAAISLVPLILLCIAAYGRIVSEGFTLTRYYLALLCAVMALSVAIQLVRSLRGDIRWLAALVPAALLVSAAGPLGAAATVTRSQTAFIEAEFGPNAIAATDLAPEAYRRLRTRAYVLESVDAQSELERFALPLGAWGSGGATPALGIARSIGIFGNGGEAAQPTYRPYATQAAIPAEGFDRVEVQLFASADVSQARSPYWIGPRLVFTEEVTLDLEAFLGSDVATPQPPLAEGVPLGTEPLPPAPVLDLATPDGRTIRLRVEGLTYDPAGLPESGTFTALYRSEEFPDGLFGSD